MREQVNETSQNNLPTAKQESIEEVELAMNILESLKTDTGHTLQWQTVQKAHHSKVLTEMQTINNINYKTRLNKMQMYFMMMMIV